MGAFVIIAFREGLEAFLVLGIVLAFLRVRELPQIRPYAWAGFLVGVILSIILGIIFTVVVDGFESEELQYNISLGVLFVAIILLTYMVFWIQHNSEAANMRQKIENSTNQKLVTFLIVFTAIVREGLETVLFFLALVMGGETPFVDGLLGLVVGFMISGSVVWLLFRSSIKMPLKSFFRCSSYLIILIVGGLISLFIKGMQGYGYLPIYVQHIYDSSFFITNESVIGKTLGVIIGYDASPSLLQFLGWASYLVTMIAIIKRRESKCAPSS